MDIEDDDEFGDLYTDLLRPIPAAAAAGPPPAAAPSDALIGAGTGTGGDVDGDDDDGILYGSSKIDVHAPPAQTLAPLAADDVDDDWMLGGPPDTVEDPASWDEVEEIPLKSEQIPGLNLAPSIKSNTFKKSSVLLEHDENLEIGNEDPVIPGLGAAPVMNCSETRRSRSDESDSDSEDDLQIVLNDAHHGPVAAAQVNTNLQNNEDDNDDDDDEDGDDFVIVANKDQQHHHHAVMEGQEWVEEATQPGGDGETKDAAEAGKGGVAAAGVVGPRLGYGGHGFHSQHHLMYKYVRPGAAPVGGATAAASVGAPGQIRPQLIIAPLTGRGRGDWRPAMGRGVSAVQKSFHPGSGLAPLGGMSNRVIGIGLDFTLPSHKSVFDVDIDSFEEKPWRLPGVDVSDFFNFGLDEDKWKEYCKRLEQLRLESTMQSKIRVYESGRSEQEHDPDLPPELAAAAGFNDTTSENLRGRSDVGQADLMGQGRGVSRAPMLTGRAIQVESGYGERLPSIDTRPPRIRDLDAIIEIVCQDFVDDTAAAVEQPGSELDREHIKGGDEAPGDDEPAESENHDSLSQTVSSRERNPSYRRAAFTPERDDCISSFPPEAALQSHSYSKSRGPAYSNPHEGRLPSRSSRGRYPNASAGHSIEASHSEHVKRNDRDRAEISEESMDANDASAPVSPAVGVENAKDVSPEQVDIDDHDEKLALGDSIEVDGEDVASDTRISFGTAGNDSLAQSSKKQKLSSRVEQPVIEDHNEGEELKVTQSDSGKGKLRKEKDNRKQHESGEVSDGKSRRGSDLRRHHEEDEHRYRRKDDYGRDGRQEIERSRAASRGYVDAYHSHAQRDLDATMIHPTRGRIELHERSKERDSSVSVWHRKDIEIHNRRLKEEEIRRDQGEDLGWKHRSKNRGGELKDRNEDMHFRKHIDDGDYRLRDREGASRQREREELLLVRRDEISDPLLRRRGEDEHIRRDKEKKEDTLHGHRLRDDSTRRKKERERDDGPDRRRREDTIRARDKPEEHHSSRHKDDNWYQKEREDRQRLKQPQEDVQKHGDREGRGASRNGVVDHKTSGNRKTRDESKKLGLTDNHHKDRRRNENSRGDQNGEEISHHRAREVGSNNDNRVSEDERISRRERSSSHNDHLSNTSNNNHNQDRQRASTRQKSENEASQVNSQSQNKRKREDNSAQHIELVYKKVRSEQQRGENGPTLNDERRETLPQAQNSILDQGEVASDDEYSDSRRGRSKLERWTSHKERDYSAVDNRRSFSSSSRVKVIRDTTTDIEKEQPGELGKSEAHTTGELEAKDSDIGHIPEKKEDLDKHLDTVAKLKRRSERFNLPMPGEKDVTGSKKNHNELPAQTETTADTDVKPERPARKRKWTSG